MKKIFAVFAMLLLTGCWGDKPLQIKSSPEDAAPIIIADGSVLLHRDQVGGRGGFGRGNGNHHSKGHYADLVPDYLAYKCADSADCSQKCFPPFVVRACKLVNLPQPPDQTPWILYAIDADGKVAATLSDIGGDIDMAYATVTNPTVTDLMTSTADLDSVTYVENGKKPITMTCEKKSQSSPRPNCVSVFFKKAN